MWKIEFMNIDGSIKTKYFKTFKGAKKHYDSYFNKTHYWFNITMKKNNV
jgi:hypothetical protein